MSSRNRGRRDFALWLGAALVLAVLAALPIATTLRYFAVQETIGARAQQVQRLRAVVESREIWEGRLRRIEESEPARRLFLDEARPSLAEAELQQRVQEVIQRNDGRVVTMSGLPRRQDLQFDHVAIQVRMQSDVRGLERTLYALEHGEPLARIDNLRVRVSDSSGRRLDSEAMTLNVVFDLVGFLAQTEAPEA